MSRLRPGGDIFLFECVNLLLEVHSLRARSPWSAFPGTILGKWRGELFGNSTLHVWENPVGKPHTKSLPRRGIETTTAQWVVRALLHRAIPPGPGGRHSVR